MAGLPANLKQGGNTLLTQERIPIAGLLDGYEAALTHMGYSVVTKLVYIQRAVMIVRMHENQGLEFLDPEVVAAYSRDIDERHYSGKISKQYYSQIKREIERFIHYARSGNCDALPSPLSGARTKLSPEFTRIAEDFLSGNYHPNTRCDMRWTVYRYFSWLEEQGFHNLKNVELALLQKFLLHISKHYAPGSVHNMRLYLKKLYSYLFTSGYSESDYQELLSFTVNRERKVIPMLPKADIARLLDTIDRNSVKGKRNYAIMLLGTVLGLRACDVVALKLTDIDWIRGEIRVVQSKTGECVILPLTQDVGEALQDYILNARPSSDTDTIFLRIRPPYTALATAAALGVVYNECCVAAGLSSSHRFHNLRRALGTSMVSNGVSVYDVAQVFGDRNVESTKPYLAADYEHLKMCALSFHGIAPSGGEA